MGAGTHIERIEAAALLVNGVVWTLPRPARHHHLIRAYCHVTGASMVPGDHEQGFVTSAGRFARRRPAAILAERAGQVPSDVERPHGLFSEDLW